MDFKKILKYGVSLWILIFVAVSIIGFIPVFSTITDTGFEFSTVGLAVYWLTTFAIFYVAGGMYFKSGKAPDFSAGIKAFVPILVVGLALDLLITVPLFVRDFTGFFGDWNLWVSIALSAIAFSIGGMYRKR